MSNSKSIQVAKSKHSALIGRGGIVIRNIEKQSGAKVDLPDRNNNSDTVKLTGTDEQIAAAIEEISSILGYKVSDEPLVNKKLKIDESRFGKLIGSRGSTLRQLERESGASIYVPRRGDADQAVKLNGSEDQVEKAKQAIEKLMGTSYDFVGDDDDENEEEVKVELHEEHAEKDQRPVDDALKASVWGTETGEYWQEFFVPKQFHGALIGRGGKVVRKLEQDTNTKIKIPRRNDKESSVRVLGKVDQMEKVQDAMEAILGFEPQPAPITAGGHKHKGAAPKAVDTSNVKKFYIPHSCFFEIVGPNGETVKGIEERENVKIKIPHKGDEETAVRIFGANEDIEDARKEIEELLGFAPSIEPIAAHFISIDKQHFNKIIGEGGATLKKLEDDSECNIIVPSHHDKEQRILLEGNDESIKKAVAAIEKLIEVPKEKKFSWAAVCAADADAKVAINARVVEAKDPNAAPEPTEEELKSMTAASARLWKLDNSRLGLNDDLFVNVQQAMAVYHTGDQSRESFFKSVLADVFVKPTYRALFALLDNYEAATGKRETVTREEEKENWRFIHACCNTAVMRYAHKWCVENGLAPKNEAAWKKMLYNAWFCLYRRGTHNDSSGFEHVFVGEFKKGAVTGFHNWLQFYREERAKKVDYRGYVVNHRRGQPKSRAKGDEHVLSIKFAWDGEEKPVSTFVLGSSPEYELALYSMCFFSRQEKNKVLIDGVEVEVTCYRIRSKYGDKIGTAFPQARN